MVIDNLHLAGWLLSCGIPIRQGLVQVVDIFWSWGPALRLLWPLGHLKILGVEINFSDRRAIQFLRGLQVIWQVRIIQR